MTVAHVRMHDTRCQMPDTKRAAGMACKRFVFVGGIYFAIVYTSLSALGGPLCAYLSRP